MTIARHYRVTGRVQGVGFRWFTEEVALREGVSGFVRNLPDGSVETEAEGDAEALLRFERALRQGPRGARVDGVEVTAITPAGRVTGFRTIG